MNIHELTAQQIIDHISAKELAADDVISAMDQRAHAINPRTNAIVRFHESAAGTTYDLPLPIGIKDNICVKGQLTTCGSRILGGFISPYDATVVTRLRDAGVPFQGALNMDEFAFGSSCETSAYGPARNPWDLDRVPGGSSGGSAAAVAAGQVVWALGSDTGGSIRQPASFCGVVGLKPTYGLVSRYGLVAFGSSLDQIGPITRDVRDCALLLNLIAGFDAKDSTSVNVPIPDHTAPLGRLVRGLRVAVPREYFIDGIDPDVLACVRHVISLLKDQGAVIHEISLPHTPHAVATYYVLATAEASSNLARFDGVKYGLRALPAQPRKTAILDMYEETRAAGFGDESKRRIMLGTYVLSSGYYDAYYLRAQKVRTLIKRDFESAFKDCDLILTPTSPTTAFAIGEKVNDPLSMYLSDIFTIPANLAGIPALSLPCGFDRKKLPVGVQLMGPAFSEPLLLQTAYLLEQSLGVSQERPCL